MLLKTMKDREYKFAFLWGDGEKKGVGKVIW